MRTKARVTVSEIVLSFGRPGGGLHLRFFKPSDPLASATVSDLKKLGILNRSIANELLRELGLIERIQ